MIMFTSLKVDTRHNPRSPNHFFFFFFGILPVKVNKPKQEGLRRGANPSAVAGESLPLLQSVFPPKIQTDIAMCNIVTDYLVTKCA